jgi:hypothetical protein
VPENKAQIHECMNLSKAELTTNLTGFARFNVKTRELTAD